jgi:hypothetical protein
MQSINTKESAQIILSHNPPTNARMKLERKNNGGGQPVTPRY